MAVVENQCSQLSLLSTVLLVITLTSITSVVSGQNPGPVYLSLNGTTIPNDGSVLASDIGEGDLNGLLCHTDRRGCCRSSDGGAHGQWYFPGQPGDQVQFEGGRTGDFFYRNRGTGVVRLNRRGNPSERGRFRCEVMNDAGDNVTVYVNIAPLAITVDVSITPSGTGNVAESYSLECTVTVTGSTDQPTITWMDPMNNMITSGVMTTGSMSTLTFNPLAASHAGTYTCRATLGSDMDSASTTITVRNPSIIISIASNVVTPTVGSMYSFTCTITGADRLMDAGAIVTYQWLKNGAVMSDQTMATLSFSPLTLSDAGDYTCQATVTSSLLSAPITTPMSNLKSIHLTLPRPTAVRISSDHVNPLMVRPVSGSPVTLTCMADLDPAIDVPVTVNIQLRHPNGSLLPTTTAPIVSWGFTYTSTATVHSFGREKSGNYTCIAAAVLSANPFLSNSSSRSETLRVTTGVYLSLKGVVYANNSVIPITEIEETNTTMPPPPNSNNGLQCVTDRSPCCQNKSNRFGVWYFPGGMTIVPIRGGATSFYRTRGDDGTVNLNRLNVSVMMPTGLFCCVVPDATSTATTTCINIVLELPTTLASTNTPTAPNPSVPSSGNPGEQGSGPNVGVVAGAIVIVLLVIVVVIVAALAIICLWQRKAGKSDFDVSANVAYGQVKVEALGDVGGEYEDPDKLWSRSEQGRRNYEPTECSAHYEFPVSKPEAPPVYATADDI